MKKDRTLRLQRQRERQQEYRDQLKTLRRPTRDDVARVALRWLINSVAAMGERKLDALEDKLIPELTRLGFDKSQSQKALADLVERYTAEHWDFQRKPHLMPCPY